MEYQQHTKPDSSTGKRKRVGLTAVFAAAILAVILIYLVFFSGLIGSIGRKKIKKVILISIDTLRADYVSCYKKGNAQTPNLDQLAKEGMLFQHCIAQTPLTLPSHTSMLSGTYPLHHQVRDNGGLQVPKQLELVSEVLKKEGFSTAAFIAAYVLHSKWGMNQGFDTYSDDFDLSKYKLTGTELEKRADVVLTDAQAWISHHKDESFFTWIHLFDPHADYEPPAPYDKKYPDNPYAGEVEYVDEQLGKFFRFLKKQGIYDECLIIVTSDHGEGLWDHGERSHGFFVYESTVHVPLIIRAPYPFPSKHQKRLVELVDIAPTILDFLDFNIPDSYQGFSMLPLIEDPDTEEWTKNVAYAESFYTRLHLGWSELQAIYQDDWKYIRAPKEELYNIREDGAEKNNTATINAKKNASMKRRLIKFINDHSKNSVSRLTELKPNKEEMKRLESLGYLTSKAQVDLSKGGELPDPKDKVAFFEIHDNAMKLMRESRFAEVVQIMEGFLGKEPGNVDVLILLGVAYSKNGQPEKAIPLMQEVLKVKPDYNDAMVNLVLGFNAVGKPDLAIKECRRFLTMFPEDFVLHNLMGNSYFLKEEYDEALKHLSRSLEIEPQNSKALLRIAEVYLLKRDYDKAKNYITKALDIFPDMHNAYFLLGRMEEEKGNNDQAIKHYKKEIENFQSNHISAFHLAEVLKKSGRYPEAIPYYRHALKGDGNFRLPYFMIANYFMETGQNLQEAIELCKKGISVLPQDESTLFGYFILTNIYAKLKDDANFKFYTEAGETLYKHLQKNKI
jgi:arylsulfatase A-like enzyme/predicted Zn-dependent protease